MLLKKTIKYSVLLLPLLFTSFCFNCNPSKSLRIFETNAKFDSDKEEYGSIYEVEPKKLDIDGTLYDATHVVCYPSDKTTTESEIILDEYGKYEVVYTATNGIKTVTETKIFLVNCPLATTGKSSSYSYGHYKYDESVDGLHISLANGDKFSYNKILNLKGLTDNDPFLRIYSETEKQGISECSALYITLTDIYNEDNFVKIYLKENPYAGQSEYFTYANVKTGSNPYAAYYYVKDSTGEFVRKNYVATAFGTIQRFSFSSTLQYGGVTMKEGYVDFALDEKEKQIVTTTDQKIIHTSNNNAFKQILSDLDDPKLYAEKWQGFTTGEVKLSIECGNYAGGANANFFIASILDHDLTEMTFADEIGPNINLLEKYENDIYPYAVVNQKYKLPTCTAIDTQTSLKSLDFNVYKNYGKTEQTKISINNGFITPDTTGIYTVEIVAKDFFGNESKKIVEFECFEKPLSMHFYLDENAKRDAYVGKTIDIPQLKISGGSGNIGFKTNIIKLNSDKTYEVIDNKFTPTEPGKYYVIYYACDYLGTKEIDGYLINVTVFDGIVFNDNPILPKYLISDFEYALPVIYGMDYRNNVVKKVEATINVKDFNGLRTLNSNSYTPKAENSGDNVEIIYSGENAEEKFILPCFITKTGSNFNKEKYFLTNNNVEISPAKDYISFKTNSDGNEIEFINSLLADGLSINFSVDEVFNNFDKVDIFVTDFADAKQKLKITIEKKDKMSSYFYINDGDKYDTNASFLNPSTFFNVYYNNKTKVISDRSATSIVVKENLDGSIFKGFSSGIVYLSFVLSSVHGDSALKVNNISGCSMNAKTTNSGLPEFELLSDFKASVNINEMIFVPEIISKSVLNPTVRISMTMMTPSGKYAVSEDGVVLKDVEPNRSFEILATEYGNYIVNCVAVDSSGKTNEFGFGVRINDIVKPEIIVSGSLPSTVKLNSTFVMPVANAVDNYSNTTIAYYCIKPNGDYILLDSASRSILIDQVGSYIFRYFAFDEFGNTNYVDYLVKAEA